MSRGGAIEVFIRQKSCRVRFSSHVSLLVTLNTLNNAYTTCVDHQKKSTELVIYSATA
jgi:hypothetical protein